MGQLKVIIPFRNAYNPEKQIVISHDFFKIVEVGNAFHALDTSANIGAEENPADTIELYFTTPAETEIIVSFEAYCSTAAAVFTLREAYTAGGVIANGDQVNSICLNRGTRKKISNLAIYKQADTITSGGLILHQEALTAGKKSGGDLSDTHPWCFAGSTKYGASIYLAAAGVAYLTMHWYERTLLP